MIYIFLRTLDSSDKRLKPVMRGRSSMRSKLTFFMGSDVPASTETLFTNLNNLISDTFDIEFVGFYGEKRFQEDVSEVIYDFPSKEGVSRLYHSIKALKKYDKEHETDLIILPHKQSVYCIPFLLSVDLNNTVVRLNGDTFNLYKDRYYESSLNRAKVFIITHVFSRLLLKKSLGVIVQTEYMKDECSKRNIDPKKISVLPLPIDTTRFKKVSEEKRAELRKELDLDQQDSVGLIIGTQSRKKRRHVLDRLLRRSKDLDDIKFVVIGDSPIGEKLSKKYSNVRYEGFVKNERLPRYYQAADFLLHFSINEGLPTTFQEATACGLPVIAMKANYNRDLNICKFKDVEELEDILAKEVWKDSDSYVTPGLQKKRYVEFFQRMIENKGKK